MRQWIVLFAVIAAVLVADQASKALVVSQLAPGQTVVPIPALGEVFRVVYSQNTGAAFGFLPDAGWLFSVIAVAVSAVMLWMHRALPSEAWGRRLAFGLIVGGALGNVIDRVAVGYVIDFINYRIPNLLSNVSNIADHAIVGGVLLLLVLVWTKPDPAPTPELPDSPAPDPDGGE